MTLFIMLTRIAEGKASISARISVYFAATT